MPDYEKFQRASAVPEVLAKLNWIFCRDGDDFEKAADILIQALDTDLEWVRAHTRLLTRAIEWESKGKNNSFVLRGVDLRAAEQWLTKAGAVKERQPTPLQTDYIIASRKASARRQQITLGAVTVGALVAIALAVVAWSQRTEALSQRKVAIEKADEAERKTREVIQTLSRSHFLRAEELWKSGNSRQAIAYLAQAARIDKETQAAASLLLSLLTQRNWALPESEPMRHNGVDVLSADFNADGSLVVTASADRTARVWEAATGTPITEPMRHKDAVYSAAFSRDGTRVATASQDGTARVWDARSGKPITVPIQHNGIVVSAVFSPDGRQLLTGSWDKTARLWNAQTGELLVEPLQHQGRVISALFSPDGESVVTASDDGTARVWDVRNGKARTQPLRHEDAVTSAMFSPDGRWVVTASQDWRARVWDAQTGKPRTEPLRHVENANPEFKRVDKMVVATFSPDGTRVVTASADKTARVWDAQTGKPLTEPMRHDDFVASAAFSPDGLRVATASQDQTARIWDAQSGKPLTETMLHDGRVRPPFSAPTAGGWSPLRRIPQLAYGMRKQATTCLVCSAAPTLLPPPFRAPTDLG